MSLLRPHLFNSSALRRCGFSCRSIVALFLIDRPWQVLQQSVPRSANLEPRISKRPPGKAVSFAFHPSFAFTPNRSQRAQAKSSGNEIFCA